MVAKDNKNEKTHKPKKLPYEKPVVKSEQLSNEMALAACPAGGPRKGSECSLKNFT